MPDLEKQLGTTGLRGRFRELDPLDPEGDPNKAYAEYVSLAPVTPLGHFEVTVSTTPTGLPSMPDSARRVVLYSITESFTYTDDGTPPSATHGLPIPAETHFIYDTDPSDDFQMWAAADTEIRVAYYG